MCFLVLLLHMVPGAEIGEDAHVVFSLVTRQD
jgi:hypothetical protein